MMENNTVKNNNMETLPETPTEKFPETPRETFSEISPEPPAEIRLENPVMEKNTPYFLGMALIYSICFAISFYKNFVGITYPLITMITLTVCGLFLKKSQIPWKSTNWCYIAPAVLLGISTVLTTNMFTIFFNTAGILLLITVFMMRQFYEDKGWSLGQYAGNILFLYLCMIPEAAAPFLHLGKYLRRTRVKARKNTNAKYIIYGILLGLPMLIFVMALLSSADTIFSKYIGNSFRFLWKNIVFTPNVFFVLFLVILGFFGIYAFWSALTLNNMPKWGEKKAKKNPLTAITFTAMITAVYLIFCVIQILFLFTGGHVLPKGYTYAEYAHQGFFQLVFVCIFNLVLVICSIHIFERNRLLKTILLVFSACTYIMIASSAYRMILYISVYHLSFLRVLVLWFLALLVILMAGVMAAVVKKSFPLFTYGMAVVSACYLIFSFSRCDYFIAEYNMAQMGNEMGYEDVAYLCSLSQDAALALAKLDFEHEGHTGPASGYQCRRCCMDEYFNRMKKYNEGLTLRTFHVSKYQAFQAAEQYFEKQN